MRNRITILWEEINFYRNTNAAYKTEDLLRKKRNEKPLHQEKIKENEERIEKLFSAMLLDEI